MMCTASASDRRPRCLLRPGSRLWRSRLIAGPAIGITVASGASLAAMDATRLWRQSNVPTFGAGVELVSVDVTVTDKDGRLITGLQKDAFRILEDGKPVDVASFSNGPVPLTVAVMIDSNIPRN